MDKLINRFLLGLVLTSAFLLAAHSLSDLDVWFHWRAGQDILAGHLHHTNFYSFSAPNRPWVDHEWLFQVLVAGVGKVAILVAGARDIPGSLAAGWNMLRIALVMALVVILSLPMTAGSTPKGNGAKPGWQAVVLILGLGLVWPRLTIRPELLSYLLFAVTVPLAEGCLKAGPPQPTSWRLILHPRTSWGALFWVTLLWAQCHGFAVLGPGILLLAGLLAAVQRKLDADSTFPAWRPWGWTLLLSWLALGLTPAGWRGWTFPLTVLQQFSAGGPDLQHTISELVPLAQSPDSLAWVITLYKICLGWGLIRIVLSLPRPNLLRSILFLAAAAAAWTNQRNLGFMAVAFVLLHQGSWGPPARVWKIRRTERVGRVVASWLPVVAVLALVGVFWPRVVTNAFYLHEGVGRRFGSGLTPAQYPVTAAGALAARSPDRVFANLDAAAYLLGNTHAHLFIDGRTEAYPSAAWAVYQQIRAGTSASLDLLDKYTVAAVCLAQGSGAADNLARALMKSSRWTATAAGPGGILWLRSDPSWGPEESATRIMAAVPVALEEAAGMSSSCRQADYCLGAARLATLADKPDQAAAALRQGLQARGDHPTLLHNLGNLEMAAGSFEMAEDHFGRAFAANPRLAGSALNAGVCALRRGQPLKAAHWFGKSLQVDGNSYQGWANLGTAYIKSGDRSRAIAAYAKAVELRPGDPGLRRRLQELRGPS